MEKARLKSVNAEAPQAALRLLENNSFNLAFLDADMPDRNGFELCTRLRVIPAHQKTPVVFVTSFNDSESRASSMPSRGSDFMAKPFLFTELVVEALIHVLRRKLEASRGAGAPKPRPA